MHRVALHVSKPRSVLHLPMFLGNLNEYCVQFQQIDAFYKVNHITVRNESYYVPGYIYIKIYVYTSYYQVHAEGYCHSPSLAWADLGVWGPDH